MIIRLCLAVFILSLFSCQSEVKTIDFGKDQCSFCRMTIADSRYGAALLTEKGRTYKYDAAECMINDLDQRGDHATLYAVPFDQPGTLMPVDSLSFVMDERYNSPMGANLAAFADIRNLDSEESTLAWKKVSNQIESKE